MNKITAAPLFFLLASCSLVQDKDAYSGLNPPKIHVNDDGSNKPPLKGMAQNITSAEELPFRQYYDALNKAKMTDDSAAAAGKYNPEERTEKQKNDIYEYVDKGTALVNATCLRWFQSLQESQTRLDLFSSDRNVITELGTTLLGLGGANKYLVSTYGASNTAIAGLEKNYSQTYFLAPNAKKVKSHIFSMLETQRAQLLKTSGGMTFEDAYIQLEKYADICTQQTAKEVIETSLDQTQSEINGHGKVSTNATPTAIRQAVASTLSDKLPALERSNQELQKKVQEQSSALASQAESDKQLTEETRKLKEENQTLQNRLNELNLQIEEIRQKSLP